MAEKPASRAVSSSGWMVMDKTWELVQKKTFTKWFNAHLHKAGHRDVISDLQKDLANGILLHKLLEAISGQKLPKINANPRMRLQNIENLNVSLSFIARCGVRLVGISAEEVTDGNLKLILGMIWTIILRFEIQDISVEDMNAKEGLLYWCQKKTKGYRDVDVRDFTRSWHDGLAFCALIHKHRPDLIDFDSLSRGNPEANLELAFDVADKKLGIPRFLDVEDMPVADERSVMTYLLQYFHVFSSSNKAELAGRRISKLVALMQANDALRNDYERRAREFIAQTEAKTKELEAREFDNTLAGARAMLAELTAFQTGDRPKRAAEKLAVEGVFANLQVKLRNAKRSPYQPPAGIAPADVDAKWAALLRAEADRERAIREEIARQERMEDMARRFFEKLAKLKQWERAKSEYLAQRPTIDTVIAAQSQLKLLDGYGKLYEASKPRVAELHQLGEQLVQMGYRDADKVTAELEWADGAWAALSTAEADKRKWLEHELEIQQEMERLRLEYAEKAKSLIRWHKDTAEAVGSDHDFGGDSLEAVTAHAAKLDEQDAAARKESAERVEELKRIKAEMDRLGVKDNKYSVVTLDDVAAAQRGLEDAIARRREAYEAELQRQQAMEAKRKEYAAAAQAVMDTIEAKRKEIDALEGEDPTALREAVEAAWAQGAPVEEKLKEAARIDREAIAMQITSNPHTKWTQPELDAKYYDAGAYVRRYCEALNEEKLRREQYAQRAQRLIAWCKEQTPALAEKKVPVASLSEARTLRASYGEFRTGLKPPRKAEKIAVLALAATLTETLAASPYHRPPWKAPEGLAPEDIEAAWAELEAAEKDLAAFVAAEVARHERLAALEKRVHEEATDLERWAQAKEGYLSDHADEDSIDSLDDAQVCLHRLDIYGEEARARAPRLEKLRANADELKREGQAGAERANEHVEAVLAAFAKLADLEAAKRAALQALLERETLRDRLRTSFAERSKAFTAWEEQQKDDLEDASFGDNLEAVRAYKQQLDELQARIRAEAAERTAEIEKLQADLQATGVAPDAPNKHTQLTMEDVKKAGEALEAALAAFSERYAKELARQEAMEAKRLEFAAAAKELADMLAASRAEVDALEGEDPAQLRDAVKARYSEAQAEKAKFADVERIYSEELHLEITSNPHTTLTCASLRRVLREYQTWVEAFIAELNAEEDMRAKYAKRAAALVQWIAETQKLLENGGSRPLDNTLAGAQAAMAAFTDYRDGTKPSKVVEGDAIKAAFKAAVSQLAESKHHRPEFKPTDPAHTPEAIDAAFAALMAVEEAFGKKLADELARQEALSQRAHDFEDAASDLEQWCRQTEEELVREENASTIEAAQIAADLVAAFDKDYAEGATGRVAPLKEEADKLAADNYSEADAVKQRCADVVALWDGLKEKRDAKAARVDAAGLREREKEALRVEWAKKAAEYEAWANDTAGKTTKHAFGTTLDAVRAHKADLDKSTADIARENDERKAALDALAAKLTEAGVTENVHTSLTPENVAADHQTLADALAKREAAYAAELERQEKMEAKREEFAAAVKAFLDLVSESHAALEKISGDDPVKCSEEAHALYGEDTAARKAIADALAACVQADADQKEAGVVENKKTPHTVASLNRKLAAHNKYYENLLAALDEEKAMQDRKKERAAEWERKEQIETLRSQYAELQAKLSAWMDSTGEALSGTPTVSTVEEVEKINEEFESLASEAIVAENKKIFDELVALAAKLTEAGVPASELGHEADVAAWEEVNKTIAARREWIAQERTRQAEHERLRKAFADAAGAFHEWLDKERSVEAAAGDPLDAQLTAATQHQAKVEQEGKAKEAALAEIDQQLQAAGVVGNPHTQHTTPALHLELQQLLETLANRKQLLEQQINSSKFSLPPEQIAEIIDLFKQFDRDHTGGLQWFQFKAVLSAIGEDMTDDEVKAVLAEYDDDKNGTISIDEFIRYMTKKRADTDSRDEIVDAFKDISGGRDFVTPADLAPVVGADELRYIQEHAPRKEGQPDAIDFSRFTDAAFA